MTKSVKNSFLSYREVAMRRYYLHTRNGVFYAALINQETGLSLTAKSTGSKNRDEALLIIADWLKNGIPKGKQKKPRSLSQLSDLKGIIKSCRTVELTAEDALTIAEILKSRGLLEIGVSKAGPGQKTLITFLKEFWDYGYSPYIRDKLAHGHKITRRYCHEALLIIAKHWEPHFDKKQLNTISRQNLRDFSLVLKEKKDLAAKSVNNILLQGTTALKWAYTENLIPQDPSAGLTRFSGGTVRRDILTEAETETLFRVKWQDRRAYIGCLLAATSGMRSGEIRAIRQGDIGEVVLDVSHSWSDFEGLKTPKNGEPRRVPLLPEIRGLLLELLAENPHAENTNPAANPFVFYSEKEDRPYSGDLLRKGLVRAIKTTWNFPPDWHRDPPLGKGRLWMIRGKKNTQGELQGEWSEPEEVTNLNTAPDRISGEEAIIEYLYRRTEAKPEKPKGINTAGRKIDVHSFRHYYASRMADKVAADKVARITGHKSKAMAAHYQAHVVEGVIAELGVEAGEVFSNILQFNKMGA